MQLILLFSNSIHQNIKGAATQLLPAKSPAPPTYLVESSTPWRASEPHEKDKTCFHWLVFLWSKLNWYPKDGQIAGFSETSFPSLKLFGSIIQEIDMSSMDFMDLCSPQILDSPKNGHDSHFEPAHHIELDKTRVPPTWNAAARCCRNFVAVVPGCFFWKPFISVSRRFLLVGNKFRKELGINSCWNSILRPQFSRISHEFFDVNFIINFLLFIFCWESSDLPLPHPSVPFFCLIRLLQVSIDLLEGFHSGSQAFILLASNLFLFSLRDIQVEFPKILG